MATQAEEDQGADEAVGGGEVQAVGDNGAAASGGEGAVPPAVGAIAATVALVTGAIVAMYDGKGTENLEEVLQGWAGLAHVAEGDFARFAAQLASGSIEVNTYQCAPPHVCAPLASAGAPRCRCLKLPM